MKLNRIQKLEQREIKTLDLFAGCGGSSYGAQLAGARIVAAIDAWTTAKDTYLDNFREVVFYSELIEQVNPLDIEKKTGHIDLILASPECTSHTCARGNGLRSEDSRMTAFQVIRFARVLKPRWIVIENVVHMKKWEKYDQLLYSLREELGYHITETTLKASLFGVPQSRRRLFISCDRDVTPPRNIPISTSPQILAKDIIDHNSNYNYSTLKTDRRAKATLERAERAFSHIGYEKPFLLVYYGSDAAGGWQSLDRPLRTVTTLDRFAYVIPSNEGHLMRMLQVPEIKAAMGFPEYFKLNYGTRRDKIHLLGNAVCPPVMAAVVRALIQSDGDRSSGAGRI